MSFPKCTCTLGLVNNISFFSVNRTPFVRSPDGLSSPYRTSTPSTDTSLILDSYTEDTHKDMETQTEVASPYERIKIYWRDFRDGSASHYTSGEHKRVCMKIPEISVSNVCAPGDRVVRATQTDPECPVNELQHIFSDAVRTQPDRTASTSDTPPTSSGATSSGPKRYLSCSSTSSGLEDHAHIACKNMHCQRCLPVGPSSPSDLSCDNPYNEEM